MTRRCCSGSGTRSSWGESDPDSWTRALFLWSRFWDEFCGTSQKGAISWVSVDEGDVVEQIRVSDERMPKFRPPFKPGETLEYENSTYTVTEVEQAECIALRGRFDEELQVGEAYG
ncbi:DUF4178 domain-containing protein [Ruegeria atlantica]|uniref:DUF4178 domain-containing protein n=1 Tax=Ruegeria atlantica TaxID=81569 RepID=UPI00147C362E|nr:DUF4178 domain-containing protein [Ruegeria atlantica]